MRDIQLKRDTKILPQTMTRNSQTNRLLMVIVWFAVVGCEHHKEVQVDSSQTDKMITDLREAYAAFNRGDIDAVMKLLDPQIEWSEPAEFPGGGVYHGHEGVKHYLTQSRAGWAEGNSEPEQFIPVGNRIVVFVYARVRPKGSNEWRERRLADVYTFREGKAVQMRAFADRQDALRWVGIRDSY